MNTSRITDFSVQESQLLADLAGVCSDLEASREYCLRLLAELQKLQIPAARISLHENLPIIEALCSAAIIRYARPSVTGVRWRIPEEIIKSLPQEQQVHHTFFMDLRNKWIGHPANAFEEHHVQLRLRPQSRGRCVDSVEEPRRSTSSLGSTQIEQLLELIRVLLLKIEPLRQSERAKVLELARSLPVDDLYDNIRQAPPMPGDSKAGSTRKKWKPLTRRCS
jgi:hypothetical protein